MTVKEFTEKMRKAAEIELWDGKDKICRVHTKSKGIEPYLDYEIVEWIPCAMSILAGFNVVAVVFIHLEDKDNEKNDNKENTTARI